VAGQGGPGIAGSVRRPPGWALRLSAPPGPSPDGMDASFSWWAVAGHLFPETGLRSHRHHQHHDPCVPDPAERHETPDPVRSSAVEPRFHGVRQRTELHDELTLNRACGAGGADVTGLYSALARRPPGQGAASSTAALQSEGTGSGTLVRCLPATTAITTWPGCPNSRRRCSRC
jgi:hypothetical protein